MAKVLATSALESNSGGAGIGMTPDRPKALALKLLQLQSGNGSWANRNSRWMEADPVLASAYSMLALELIRARL
jgi:squalene-hopene/tetraprenyl-beta-curcumene cyclase